MKVKCFTIHDNKAGAYLPPFFLPNEQMAQRTFSDCVNDDEHSFGKHPADYTLFAIGDFDDQTGHLDNHTPIAICNGVDCTHPLSETEEKQLRDNIAILNAEARSA